MDWSALTGAFIGAAIPAVITYVQVLRGRQAVDAQSLGPALLLVDRLDPIRLTMNVGSADVEAERWKVLDQQVNETREQLLVIAAGHPRREVRRLAERAQVALANMSQASGWAVSDLLRNRDNPDWMEHARTTHEEARGALRALIDATFRRGLMWRRRQAAPSA